VRTCYSALPWSWSSKPKGGLACAWSAAPGVHEGTRACTCALQTTHTHAHTHTPCMGLHTLPTILMEVREGGGGAPCWCQPAECARARSAAFTCGERAPRMGVARLATLPCITWRPFSMPGQPVECACACGAAFRRGRGACENKVQRAAWLLPRSALVARLSVLPSAHTHTHTRAPCRSLRPPSR